MKKETYKFIVPIWSLPYIINGNIENLTPDEIKIINEKLEGFTCFSYDSDTFFSYRNDINNLGAECTILTALKND